MIYVLELENNKYYIGFTQYLDNRIQKHFDGTGSSWTKLYKPIKILETFDGGKDEERETTLRYMAKYGWQNVRGGGWTAVSINKPILLK